MTRDDWHYLWRSPIVRFQWLVFDLVWLITATVVAAFVFWVTASTEQITWSSDGLKIAVAVGAFITFLHKHALECERECLGLFEKYNESFAKLDVTKEALISDHKLAEKYLDLCSEEYLLYLQGRIHPTIWRSWAEGMREYLHLKELKERLGDGRKYYGLTLNRVS